MRRQGLVDNTARCVGQHGTLCWLKHRASPGETSRRKMPEKAWKRPVFVMSSLHFPCFAFHPIMVTYWFSPAFRFKPLFPVSGHKRHPTEKLAARSNPHAKYSDISGAQCLARMPGGQTKREISQLRQRRISF